MTREQEIFDLLGSKTRRRILELIAERPRFLTEMSEELEIGRKAVIEHLNCLESHGVIRSSQQRIKKGRPRKYYEISRSFFISVFISPLKYETEMLKEGKSSRTSKFDEMIFKTDSLDDEHRHLSLSSILSDVERQLSEIEGDWVYLKQISERIRRLLRT